MIKVFIGFDPRETIAYHVLSHSIHARASMPISITPLMLSQLNHVYTRPPHALQSTDFAFTRFLVPYLSDYSGWSIFMDCDMLCIDDIVKLYRLRDDRYAVMVVKRDHKPIEDEKFLRSIQTHYSRKNWSSVMLMNNAKCKKALTPAYIHTANGLDLHQFKWIEDELVGALPPRWNHLVGYDAPTLDVSLLHYTTGGPWFKQYETCETSILWEIEKARTMHVDDA